MEKEPIQLGQEFISPSTYFRTQPDFDNKYIRDLVRLKKTVTSIPTFIPKKFIDQIQFVYTGGSYYLYIYLDGAWKKTTLT